MTALTQHICPTCHQPIRERWESLSKGLIKTLGAFAEASIRKNNKVHLQKDMTLDKNQYNNFQKLRYFGLVAKIKDTPGCWLLTTRGSDFIFRDKYIPKKVKVVNNHKVDESEELTNAALVIKTQPYWNKIEDYSQGMLV